MLRNVEIRSPFMDYRLVEFGKSLPDEYIFCDNQPKAILRQILENRGYKIDSFGKKIGFSIIWFFAKRTWNRRRLRRSFSRKSRTLSQSFVCNKKKISQKIFTECMMKNQNQYFSGEKLIGDDFSKEKIIRWFKEEEQAYSNLTLSKKEKYEYEYKKLNEICGFRLYLNFLFQKTLYVGLVVLLVMRFFQ